MKNIRDSAGEATARLRKLIYASLKNGSIVSASEASRSLGLSVRTLQRQLDFEGNTFSKTLADVRHELATEMLQGSNKTIGEISAALGYTSVANFSRAFHRWTGVSPSEFRNQ